jgi:hypothetical protein
MTRKLLLTIALGTTIAVVAAGTATSTTPDMTVGLAEEVEIGLPPGEELTGEPVPRCADLLDNDRDGKQDLLDPGCRGPLDNTEAPVPPGKRGAKGGGEGPGSLGPGGGGGIGPAPDKGVAGGLIDQIGPGSESSEKVGAGEREKIEEPQIRNPDGSPTKSNPNLTIAQFGPAPIGVPNFIIDQFEIPPFLLPIYQACGTQYGIPWQVLASINRIETAFGTNLNVSSAGAMGWMQFIPSSWRAYGVDANQDGRKDPYNPVDAICAAARYLRAAGAARDLREAIFAYNHADWYVDEVLLYANQYAKLPDELIASITGLTEGAHFPVAANARYADDISEREALARSKTNRVAPGNAADVIAGSPTRRGINIYSRVNAPVVAVNDGVIRKLGESPKLGRYVVLQDAYGNRYTYAQLGSISKSHPVPRPRALTAKDFELVRPGKDPSPAGPASAGDEAPPAEAGKGPSGGGPVNTEELRRRLFALPERPANIDRAGAGGQLDALLGSRVPAYETFKSYFSGVFRFDRRTMKLEALKVGSQVAGGTVLGRIGRDGSTAPHVHFAIQPAGRGAPKIDPKPILDGWKLLETTAIYRAVGEDPFGSDASVGQILLMSKADLQRRVLADPRLGIYSCGRLDIRTGQVDRRILATLEYLAERGYRLTLTSLKCGHSFLTSSGNVSAHSSGNAVDIAEVNGLPILGNQGRGTITEAVIRDLMLLQGTMKPAQIISLMELGAPTFALSDHDDHIHVGFTPLYGSGKQFQQLARILKPEQWERLIERLGEIENPVVPVKPSKSSIPDRGSDAHRGE